MTECAYEEGTDGGNLEVKDAGGTSARIIGILEGTVNEGRLETRDTEKTTRGESEEPGEFRTTADLSRRQRGKNLSLPGERETRKDLSTSQEGRGVSRVEIPKGSNSGQIYHIHLLKEWKESETPMSVNNDTLFISTTLPLEILVLPPGQRKPSVRTYIRDTVV
ncbi:hypothetical protein NDU88_007466 [Pleurodeles waltl]|uniref:Uncharacterized protein n=1 Tax=Pleurodeles waltl TaxID=8319 RepID=A0AAV7VSS1_PLEWA|nr:hypothetical protein NDU88_007466 [Pleurodeles waltl]